MLTRRHLLASPLLAATPDVFRYSAELEPLVRLIEDTPRDKCAVMAVEQMRRGTTLRQFMAALFLAGIRNVNPRPPGFALHCVFVIHAAHTLALEAPTDVRALPLFYALDNFKSAQERDAKAQVGDYTMRALSGSPGHVAAALDAWDIDRAERAAVWLARESAPGETFEVLWKYGARDYRNIGHKAIYAANAERTLRTIGWQHAEPVLRSLVLSLADFGPKATLNGFAFDDQCYHDNTARVGGTFARLPAGWGGRSSSPDQVRSILAALRSGTSGEVCADVAARLMKGQSSAGSVWDAVHLSAAELRMRAGKGTVIGGIHAVSAMNGLHHAYSASTQPRTRYLLTLQAAGWIVQFRHFMAAGRDGLRAWKIDEMRPADKTVSVDEVLAMVPGDLDQAAAGAMRLAAGRESRAQLLAGAARLSITKVDEVHFYKYLAALMEDIPQVDPTWQPSLAAAVVYYMKGPGDPDATAIKHAREALGAMRA